MSCFAPLCRRFSTIVSLIALIIAGLATGCVSPKVTITLTPSMVTLDPGKSQAFTVVINHNGAKGVSWSISPSDGTLSNQSTSGVTYTAPAAPTAGTVTLTATSVQNPHVKATATITLSPALSITTASLNPGTVGIAYSATLANTGGISPYSWSITSGSLPAGLTLSSGTGTISGTPLSAGTSSFTLQVSDSSGLTATANLTLTINLPPALSVTTSSLAGGITGVSYSATVSATGGVAPLAWSIATGSLPLGLALNAGNGAITGTPTTAGTMSFTVQVKDAAGQSASANLSIAINAALMVTTASLNSGSVNTAYAATLAATGGSAPYTWSIKAGSLPAGLTLNVASGAIAGTPTTSGTFNFTVQVKDSAATPQTASANLSIVINAALAITTASLNSGTVNTAYSATLSATGGTTPYTWSILTGSVPAGLTLNASTGVISGTPTTSGTSNFTVQVKDSSAQTATANLSITISSATLSITTTTLSAGIVNTAYSATLAGSGGTTPYTWSIASGSLPAGLTLNASTGAISGTPTTPGTPAFTVQLKDSSATPQTTTANFSITINPAKLTISTSALASGTVNAAYSATLSATGGTSPYTWSIASGSLSAGLTLNASTGAITGTPTTAGTSNFTVQVKDSAATPQTTTANLSITINAGTLSVITASLNSGTVNTAYSAMLQAAGGTTPYTWSLTSGSLPAGLTLNANTGAISGTPTTSGTSNFTVQAKDSSATPQTATANLSITINVSALVIDTTVLPAGSLGVAYSGTLSASGGTTPYTWSITSGSLPPGLALDSATGVVSGTPTQSQLVTLTVQLQDSSPTPQVTTGNVSLRIYSGMQITTLNLAYSVLGSSYSASMGASGGKSPYTWSIASGSLPPGLTLSSSGSISGTSTATGTYLFEVQVQDSEATPSTLVANFSITIVSSLPLTVDRSTFSAELGSASNAPLSPVAGTGTGPFTWSLYSGTLPPGLSLSSSGLISGTSTSVGTYNFVVQVTDATGATSLAPDAFTIEPAGGLVIYTTSLPDANVGYAYHTTPKVSGTGLDTYSISSGSLPAGLTLNAGTGQISGTPTVAGSSTFTYTVTDSSANHASQSYTINVYDYSPCPSGSESELTGSYVFSLNGFAGFGQGFPKAAVIAFTANGSGGITSAEGDFNVSTANGSQSETFTAESSYSVGANGQGCMTLVGAGTNPSYTFAFVLGGVESGIATRGSIFSFDSAARAASANGIFSSPDHATEVLEGTLLQQNTSASSVSGFAPNFAFSVAGHDSKLGRFAMIGSLDNSSTGVFSSVTADSNDGGSVKSASNGSGGFSGTADAHGRLLASISAGGTTYNYVAYIVNADQILLVSSDSIGTSPITAGTMLGSQPSGFSSELSGNFIFYGGGSDTENSGRGLWSTGGLSISGSAYSGTQYEHELNCPCSNANGAGVQITGTLSVDGTTGRVTLTPSGAGSPSTVLYLTGSTANVAAFILDDAGPTAWTGNVYLQPSKTYSDILDSPNYLLSGGERVTNIVTGIGVGTASGGNATLYVVESTFASSLGTARADGNYVVSPTGFGGFGVTDDSTNLITNGTLTLMLDFGNNSDSLLMLQVQ